MESFKWLWSYEGFKLKVSGFPQICSVPSETASDPKMFWRCENMLNVFYYHAMLGGPQILPATRMVKNVEYFCLCLSVCPSRFRMTEFVCMISP